MPAPIRLGTCSWADQGLIERWYPSTVKSAEARLRYYAEHYDTVEVNSSYYAIPEAATASRWPSGRRTASSSTSRRSG